MESAATLAEAINVTIGHKATTRPGKERITDPSVDSRPERTARKSNVSGEGGEGVEPRIAGELTTGLPYWGKIFNTTGRDPANEDCDHAGRGRGAAAAVRMAWIEEELRRREVEHNRERVMRQSKGAAKWTLSRKSGEWLLERACRGNLESIEELERRGIGSEAEHRKWRELNLGLVERAAKAREAMKMKREQEKVVGKGAEVAEVKAAREEAVIIEEMDPEEKW